MIKQRYLFLALGLMLTHFGVGAWEADCDGQNIPRTRCESKTTSFEDFKEDDHSFAKFIEKYYSEIKQKIKSEIDGEKHLFRHMRGLKSDPQSDELEKRYLKRVESYQQLKELFKLEASAQQKMEVCFRFHCSATQKDDLVRERNHFRSLKVLFLVKNPKLTSEKIEASLSSTEKLNDIELRKMLMESSSDFLAVRQDFLSKNNNAQASLIYFSSLAKNKNELEEFQDNALLRRPYLLENLHHHLQAKIGVAPKDEQEHFCRILNLKEDFETEQLIKRVALEAGLIIGPFLFPPLGSAKLGQGLWLARFGMNAKKSKALIGALSSQAASVSTGMILINQVERECKRKASSMVTKASVKKQKEIDQCYEDLSDEYLFLAVSEAISLGRGIRSGLRLAFPKAAKLADKPSYLTAKGQLSPFQLTRQLRNEGLKKLGNDKSAFVFKSGVKEYTGLYDLEKASKLGADHAPLTTKYWDYVADIYSKRLKLSDAEVKGFLKSSREMEDRTLLVLKSKAHPANGPPEFTGGAGVVKSREVGELLPLEKATGFKVPREKGEKIYEVVRLVSTDADNPDHMKEILGQVLAVLKKDEGAKKIYVFTSKIHQRLYRKLGIPFKVIDKPNSRDVIMEFDISKFDVEDL